ncbi:DUF4334 domain-containing protein [Nocardia stercoris]|uniref:DUF4334 domain-containing protein n=1 Tax=Nocardia stercoris TaxID=2483361 RepID=A0A3M2L8Q0_9NOCA|nr:DUF4334 domain-containing protein [Nocardia stercoris]RMI33416.1 DUF4334 domain-containing protein [Nocardia stercoris]
MDHLVQLAALEPATTTEDALKLFDQLPAVRSADVLGGWVGRELATGHPMDGVLAASGWYGKRFDDVDSVHPMLFKSGNGRIWAADPRRLPLGLVGKVSPQFVEKARRATAVLVDSAVETTKHRARLRDLEYRGVVSAAMVYDHLPIIDTFRRVDENTLLGAMDQRGVEQPYFFVLVRDTAA